MAIDMRTLAREGARARVAELLTELAELRSSFPELVGRMTMPVTAPRRGRRSMSPAERKAVGIRMKAYWAARRKAKA